MDTAVRCDRKSIMAAMEENQKNIRSMVMESYHHMLEGKGRSSSEFFEELEGRYDNAQV